MSRVKVSLPDQTLSEIDRLVEQGEFLNQDAAVEDLLKRGISAYETTETEEEAGLEEDAFSQMTNDQQDPAMQDDEGGDDYGF